MNQWGRSGTLILIHRSAVIIRMEGGREGERGGWERQRMRESFSVFYLNDMVKVVLIQGASDSCCPLATEQNLYTFWLRRLKVISFKQKCFAAIRWVNLSQSAHNKNLGRRKWKREAVMWLQAPSFEFILPILLISTYIISDTFIRRDTTGEGFIFVSFSLN